MAKQKKQFLPEGVKLFFYNRMIEAVGCLFFLSAVLYSLALFTYSSDDISLNTKAGQIESVNNVLGWLGSYTSDFAFQLFGIFAYWLIPILLAWTWRCFTHEIPKLLPIKLIALGAGLITMGAFSALMIQENWLSLSIYRDGYVWHGVSGLALIDLLHVYYWQSLWQMSSMVIAGCLAIAGITSYIYAVSLKRTEWYVIFRTIGRLAYKAVKLIWAFTLWLGKKIFNRNAQEEAKPKVSTKKKVVKAKKPMVEAQPVTLVEKKTKSKKKQEDFVDLIPKSEFLLPSVDLLQEPKALSSKALQKQKLEKAVLQESAELLEKTLEDFGVKGEITGVHPGPVVTLFELEPAPGTKTSRVVSLADDIARSMSAISARVAVVPGKNVIGIELPNPTRETVYLKELIGANSYESTASNIALALGKDISGSSVVIDLARMPHLLVAGTTGSGKSVAVNAMLLSILYRLPPDQCRLILIDPKMLELSVYDKIPHLLTPVVTDPKEAIQALKWAVREMENRYRSMSKLGVRNITGYNQRLAQARANGEILTKRVQTGYDHESGDAIYEDQTLDLSPLPYIVIVVDEIADLMLIAGKDVEAAIQRLAQMARAAGIHLILATQRPSVDVITGTIKANLPSRISFQVTSKIDSRTILGEQGAEQLLGMGDMLYMVPGGRIRRVHGPFVSDKEVEQVVTFLRKQGEPEYNDGVVEEDENAPDIPGLPSSSSSGDELYDKAVSIVLSDRKASTSYIQRRLQIGYNRAARLIEKMEDEGVIGKPNRTGKREIIVKSLEEAS